MSPADRPPQGAEDANGLDKLNLHGLSTADYLKVEPVLSVGQKTALATRLATSLNAQGSDPDESANAEAILRVIVWNAEASVIASMAQAAADNPNTPHSLAWALANDEEAAAMPILKASTALSDTDLVAIVEATESSSKMGAIAGRSTVGVEVSRSLARCGDENTVHLLLGNANADIPDDAYASMLDRHGQHERIQAGIIGRDALSSRIATRLSGMVSGGLADQLAQRHQVAAPADLPFPVGVMDGLNAEDLDELVAEMVVEGSINASFLVRKLCLGNFEFFCRALAAKAQTPNDEVRAGVAASAADYLPALWEKAALSVEWLPVASAAVTTLVHIDQNYGKADPEVFRKNIVDRTVAALKADKHVLTDAQKKVLGVR